MKSSVIFASRQTLAQPRDGGAQRDLRAVPFVVGPERVHQAVDRDHEATVDEQAGDEGARLGAADVDDLSVPDDLDRAEDADLEAGAPSVGGALRLFEVCTHLLERYDVGAGARPDERAHPPFGITACLPPTLHPPPEVRSAGRCTWHASLSLSGGSYGRSDAIDQIGRWLDPHGRIGEILSESIEVGHEPEASRPVTKASDIPGTVVIGPSGPASEVTTSILEA